MKTIIVLHGPNLDLLGKRQPEIYGENTLNQVNQLIAEEAKAQSITVQCFQGNDELSLCDFVNRQKDSALGIVINPGILSHYAIGLGETIKSSGLPAVEVHLSNIHARERFRRRSVIAEVCVAQIAGLGVEGYLAAIRFLVKRL